MTEIKRFVSYIYSYNHGVREKNVGFAKVDSRNGQCKLAVNIKNGTETGRKEQEVYLFYRKKEELTGVYIGSFPLENGVGEFHEQLLADNLVGSGKSLDEMNGIFIRLKNPEESATVYASGWDDYEIHINQFKPQREEAEPMYPKREPVIFFDRSWQEERPAYQEVTEVHAAEIDRELDRAEEKADSRQSPQWEEAPSPVQTEKIDTGDVVREETVEGQDRAVQAYQDQGIETTGQKNVQKDSPVNTEGRARVTPEQIQLCDETKWEGLCHQFPKIRAFVDEPERVCLKIDLKDIRQLPTENWVLGNNSFLLHGYYNFRYLILTPDQESEEVMLGIPGIFHPNERMMASMFGFDGFKPVKECETLLGQFGYWYRKVKLEQ